MKALRNSKEWSDRDIEKSLSSEALTAAVMQRYHIIASTRETLQRTLRGAMQSKTLAGAKPAPGRRNYQQLGVGETMPPGLVLA
jgi:hypothetical protein